MFDAGIGGAMATGGYWDRVNAAQGQDQEGAKGIGTMIQAIMARNRQRKAQKQQELQMAQAYNNQKNANMANEAPAQMGPQWGMVNMPQR